MTSLSILQAAQRLGVSRRTVYYYLHDGRLQSVPVLTGQRVTIASIEALERMREAA